MPCLTEKIIKYGDQRFCTWISFVGEWNGTEMAAFFYRREKQLTETHVVVKCDKGNSSGFHVERFVVPALAGFRASAD